MANLYCLHKLLYTELKSCPVVTHLSNIQPKLAHIQQPPGMGRVHSHCL